MSSQNIKGLKVELDSQTTGLEAAMKRIGKGANDINKELSEVQKGLKFDPSNTVLIAQKQELLKDKIHATRQGLDALKQAQDRVEAMYKSGEIDKGQYRAFQREVATSESKLKTFEAQVKDVERAQDKAGHSTGSWGDKLKNVAGKAALAAGAAVVALTVAIGALANKVLNNADELQKMADKTGLSAERLQELQYIGADVGVELETIAGAQAKLTKAMNAGRDGTGAQADAFKKLGISVVDSNGNLRDAKEVMLEAFDALNGVGNETERDAMAMAIFGKSAQELNPLIKAGTGRLSELADQARETGAVMSNESVAALDAFGDSTDQLKMSIMAMIGTALAPLMPKLMELTQSLSAKIGPAMQWVTEKLIPALTGAFTGEGGLGTALTGVMAIMGIVKDVFILAWPMIKQAVQMFVDFFAGPAGQALVKGLLEAIGAALTVVQQVFQTVWPMLQGLIQQFIDWFNSPTGQALIKGLLGAIVTAVQAVGSIFQSVWSAIGPVLGPLLTVILDLLQPVVDIFNVALGPAIDAAAGLLKTAFKGVKAVIGPIVDGIVKVLQKIVDVIDAVKEGLFWIKTHPGETNVGTTLPGRTAPAGQRPGSAPGNARGSIIDRPTLTWVGEGGSDEVIAPTDDPLRSLQLLSQSGLLASMAALVSGRTSVSNSSTSTANTYHITIDGSRMPTPDFNGLIASIQTAQRMGG